MRVKGWPPSCSQSWRDADNAAQNQERLRRAERGHDRDHCLREPSEAVHHLRSHSQRPRRLPGRGRAELPQREAPSEPLRQAPVPHPTAQEVGSDTPFQFAFLHFV